VADLTGVTPMKQEQEDVELLLAKSETQRHVLHEALLLAEQQVERLQIIIEHYEERLSNISELVHALNVREEESVRREALLDERERLIESASKLDCRPETDTKLNTEK
jgi:hypothetical protein